jgi:two-component system CheB/CheR fusion protein
MIHIFAGAERFLKPRGGRQSSRILDVIHDSLHGPLSTAMRHAVSEKTPVLRMAALFGDDKGKESISISVDPIAGTGLEKTTVFIEFSVNQFSTPPNHTGGDDHAQIFGMHQTHVLSLENELRYSQDNLQATIEEMEAANEELQTTNEELLTSNEELQSTNEELQSVNEELYTVNAEHQRRVEELAQANDDMDNLLASTRVGVIFLDKGLYIRRFTPEIARVLRLEPHDTGRSIEAFSSRLSRPSLIDDLREALNKNSEKELKVEDRLGNPYLLRIMPYHSLDATGGLVITLIDIKSLADAEAEIRLQQLAIETAVNGIIITDPRIDGNPITYVNQGFLKLTGYEKNEVLGRNCRFLQGDDTDAQAVVRISEAIRRSVACRTTLLNYRKNGEPFWNDLQITPVLDAFGSITHFVGVQHDVTEQMRAQQALKSANEAARIASEAKSSFLATMSHELRTPMTAVLGFAEMLKSESDDPEYLEKVDTIKRNGTYLLALLNDILDLSKVEAGKLQFLQENIDIRSVVAEVESLMQIRAREMKVPLRFEIADPLPAQIVADATRVRQILVNLTSNALKFSDSSEVVVSTYSTLENGRTVLKISVRDSGIGISKEQLSGLFTPFNQLPRPSTRTAGGTGLGLSISKRLAEGIGASIEVESELGVGSCFTLCLPIKTSKSRQTKARSQVIQRTFQPNGDSSDNNFPSINGRVLLADDRRDVWRVGKYFLEKCGADVTIVENGKQAVEAVSEAVESSNPFSLVLMDMQMPVMTGHDAVRELRRKGFDLPIIALTADAMEGEREACIEMGCNEYFPKPIDGPRLMNSIAELINGYHCNE